MPHPQAEPARYRRSSGPGLMRTRSMGSAHRIQASARVAVGAFTKGNLGNTDTAPVRPDDTRDWTGETYRPAKPRAVKPARKPGPLDQRQPRGALTRGIPARREVYTPREYVNAECRLSS